MLNRLNRLDHEEAMLRRRLLFRMLRGFNFDNPRFRSETISDAIPRELINRDCAYFPPQRPKTMGHGMGTPKVPENLWNHRP